MAMKKSDFKYFNDDEVNNLERVIDKRLTEPSDRMLTFSTVGWSAAVKDEIGRRYRESGWTVEFVSDQRDGDFMVLK